MTRASSGDELLRHAALAARAKAEEDAARGARAADAMQEQKRGAREAFEAFLAAMKNAGFPGTIDIWGGRPVRVEVIEHHGLFRKRHSRYEIAPRERVRGWILKPSEQVRYWEKGPRPWRQGRFLDLEGGFMPYEGDGADAWADMSSRRDVRRDGYGSDIHDLGRLLAEHGMV